MRNAWLVAALALLPPLLVAIIAAGRGAVHARLIAVELATSLAIVLLIVLSFAFNQASSIDLALTLALLTMPGAMLLALFQERWL
jgi:multisubunit Na+/H+ antiporter MnhF subunit